MAASPSRPFLPARPFRSNSLVLDAALERRVPALRDREKFAAQNWSTAPRSTRHSRLHLAFLWVGPRLIIQELVQPGARLHHREHPLLRALPAYRAIDLQCRGTHGPKR